VESAPTIPKDGTHLLAASATTGRLNHFSVLALQQHDLLEVRPANIIAASI